jgi:hypothetical protein
MSHSFVQGLTLTLAIVAWIGLPTSFSFDIQTAACPSGLSQANLTGWMLNGKMPSGTASYNSNTKQLDVSVESIGLPDGTTLQVLKGDDRIGQIGPLVGGKANGTVTAVLDDGARVRVFDGERPLVSANLVCVAATPTPTSTETPTPTPTQTQTPTPTPTPTVTPSPTVSPGEPTPDPMPKPSPFPSPTPNA